MWSENNLSFRSDITDDVSAIPSVSFKKAGRGRMTGSLRRHKCRTKTFKIKQRY